MVIFILFDYPSNWSTGVFCPACQVPAKPWLSSEIDARPHAAFTLVEILVVMGVMAIILGISVPVFTHIGGANSLKSGGNQMEDLAEAARQNSMSKNAMTALIVPIDTTFDNRFRIATLLELTPHADGTKLTSGDWRQISKWEVLPTGVIVDAGTSTTFDDTSSASTQLTPAFPASLRYGLISLKAFKYIVFLAGGNLLEASNAQIRLDEGFYGATAATPTYTHAAGNLPLNYYDIFLLSGSGRTKIVRP